MSLFCGLDPGITTGVCLYDPEGHKIKAGILDDTWWPSIWAANQVIIEKPQIYRQHPRPQDLITLALKAGELAGMYKSQGKGLVRWVFPREWKRQLDKDMSWDRILLKLEKREMYQLTNLDDLPATKRHNAQDAVGIALFGAGKVIF